MAQRVLETLAIYANCLPDWNLLISPAVEEHVRCPLSGWLTPDRA